jgi:hypothetical protein
MVENWRFITNKTVGLVHFNERGPSQQGQQSNEREAAGVCQGVEEHVHQITAGKCTLIMITQVLA